MPFISTIGGGSAQGFGRGGSAGIEEFIVQYDYTGSSQTFSIPAGITEVEAFVFGPGGGVDSDEGLEGGAGGFVSGTINTSSGGTLKIIVGGGGGPGTQNNGSGGGYSAIATNNWAGSTVSTDHGAIIICSGGGGGSGNGGETYGGKAVLVEEVAV